MALKRISFFLMLFSLAAKYASGGVSTPSTVATYSAATGSFTPVVSPTDVFQIYGSATKTVKILKIYAHYAVSSGNTPWVSYLIKRSAANSSGTPTTATNIPLDSNNAAATAVVKHYTTNPTLGTAVGNISIVPLAPTSHTGVTASAPAGAAIFDSDKFGQPLVLRGTAEGLVVNYNSTSQPNTSTYVGFSVIWTEE